MSDPFIDYYALLGLPSTASIDEIKRARRRKLAAQHPDRNGASESAAKTTRLLNEVKSVLFEPAARARYDVAWHWHRAQDAVRTRTRPQATATSEGAARARANANAKWPFSSAPSYSTRRAPSTRWDGLLGTLGAAVLIGGAAYLFTSSNTYDEAANRFRGRDGRFRRGRFR